MAIFAFKNIKSQLTQKGNSKQTYRELPYFFDFSGQMTNFDPGTRNCHVIHQIEAKEPRIIIKLNFTENFYPESKHIEKLKFRKFSPMTS